MRRVIVGRSSKRKGHESVKDRALKNLNTNNYLLALAGFAFAVVAFAAGAFAAGALAAGLLAAGAFAAGAGVAAFVVLVLFAAVLAGLFAALLAGAASPQAIPRELTARTVESTITLVISKTISCLLQKLN